ncbi:MAG: CbiX/SirB N-terminal domain-containing protein [Gammaproteobacteria bacterium]|jgi:sirohydrochlorin ferrochelatase|nr:CbiX/SirB N-terminal domain-containing protein [Gammaproteobacteria bacterium]
MKTLILVAHGSRREASNEEVRELARQMQRTTHPRYTDIRCAFLELAEPTIPDGIRHAIADGASEVDVLPYFLVAGRHVAEDIPAEVAKAQSDHPDRVVRILPYLGSRTGIMDLLHQT